MATQKQIEALALWRVAEGKAPKPGAPLPTRRQREAAQIKFAESIAYGDLPTQLLPSLRRTLVRQFEETPVEHGAFTTRFTVQGIDVAEPVEVYKFDQDNVPDSNMGDKFIDGGLPSIGRREPYPQIGLSATDKSVKASKFGEAFGIDWEAVVNSRGRNVNLVRDAIEEFGRHARQQEDINVAKLLVNGSGFVTGNLPGGALAGNPDFTDPTQIADALVTLMNREVNGKLPDYDRFVVLTSRANAPKIRQAIGSRRIVRNPGATSGASWEETLEYGVGVEVIGWRWLQKIWPSIGKGFLVVPVPSTTDAPVLSSVYLDGYETPSMWVKQSNAISANGGGVGDPMDGDFDSDAILTKVRHVHGAQALWTEGIGYSTGANV